MKSAGIRGMKREETELVPCVSRGSTAAIDIRGMK